MGKQKNINLSITHATNDLFYPAFDNLLCYHCDPKNDNMLYWDDIAHSGHFMISFGISSTTNFNVM